MTRWLGFLSLLLALGLSLSANSTDGQEPRKSKLDLEGFFTKLDLNHDGKLTQDEFLQIADRFKDRTKAREKLITVYDKIDPAHRGVDLGQFKEKFKELVEQKKPATMQ